MCYHLVTSTLDLKYADWARLSWLNLISVPNCIKDVFTCLNQSLERSVCDCARLKRMASYRMFGKLLYSILTFSKQFCFHNVRKPRTLTPTLNLPANSTDIKEWESRSNSKSFSNASELIDCFYWGCHVFLVVENCKTMKSNFYV